MDVVPVRNIAFLHAACSKPMATRSSRARRCGGLSFAVWSRGPVRAVFVSMLAIAAFCSGFARCNTGRACPRPRATRATGYAEIRLLPGEGSAKLCDEFAAAASAIRGAQGAYATGALVGAAWLLCPPEIGFEARWTALRR